MGGKREEERNEKIIRGLMKLPPNRRCINCNGIGPQYVCTSFWTFICIACSGIHREFTHRVKSVSMSKFTTQEVEALQMGGNQRAREIFLKDWDPQRMRLPDSSNVDKLRSFIKNVYVDKKFSGGKTSDKPPRDMQGLRSHEDQTRRASSYHSYSQSPPYDHQYEDRRYGKQAALTRKPGSDRGLYEGKLSSFLYSPGRLSDQMYEDRFANEGSLSRYSDYSASSGGETFRSGAHSPNFQDTGMSSLSSQPPGYVSTEQSHTVSTPTEANFRRDADGIPFPQRTVSLGSAGTRHFNPLALKSVKSGSYMAVVSEQGEVAGVNHISKPSVPGSSGALDLFEAPFAPGLATSSASSIDLFQLPATSSVQSVDLFQSKHLSNLPEMSQELSVPKNEGWATFDVPQPTVANQSSVAFASTSLPSTFEESEGNLTAGSFSNMNLQSPSFQSSSAGGLSSTTFSPWENDVHKVQDSALASKNSWNAFEDFPAHASFISSQQRSQLGLASESSLTAASSSFSAAAEDSMVGVSQTDIVDGVSSALQKAPLIEGPSYAQSDIPFMGKTNAQVPELKSTNPFDIPYDSEESSDLFLNMSSLQSTLPATQLPPSFLGGVSQPWFPQNPATAYLPSAAQGYAAGPTSPTQLSSVPTQGPVASIGGNPFA